MEFMIYGKQANLITRPRRFGKSTNLSMLYTFLAPPSTEEEKTQRLSLFKDLRIYKYEWFIKSNFGNWPVIYISFKVSEPDAIFYIDNSNNNWRLILLGS